MENYQRFFLNSLPPTSLPDVDCNTSNVLNLFANFHGNNTTRNDHDRVKQVLGFEGHVEASYNEFHIERGVSNNHNDTLTKQKSETKKSEKSKRHRFAFQTRSQVDVLDDGYRWRKYGQKLVKNSKFPRSYYKCTVQGCNVKKQIQRLCGDEEIVVTTYEGMHTHSTEKSSENFNQILKQLQTPMVLFNELK